MAGVAAVIKPALDENLPPIKDFNLRQWNLKFQELTAEPDLIRRDIFALTGHYTSDNDHQVYRARLDDDTCKLVGGAISQSCDIDSVIGVVQGHFPIANQATFKYYMLPSFTHTLEANLHIPGVRVYGQDEDDKPIELHKIPNARFAEMGDNFIVRIALPELRHEAKEYNSPNYIGEGRLRLFYDRAIQPAAVEILPDNLVRLWPPNFDNEMFRAGNFARDVVDPADRRRLPQHTSRDVHAQYLNPWLDAIRRRVAEDPLLDFARGFLLLVEGKGTKNRDGVSHRPPAEDLIDDDGNLIDPENDRTRAVNHLLREFDQELFPETGWYLDIATTVSYEDDNEHPLCLFASPDSHPEIIKHFSGTNIGQCENFVLSNSGGYERDEVAHTGVFAGFRIPFEDPGDEGVCYLQVYSSEKSVTYRVDAATKAKVTSVQKVLRDWPAEKKDYFVPLQAALTSASATHSVALRIESRVKYHNYPTAHHEIHVERIWPWLRYANNSAFWGFKAKRLMAISNVLNRLMQAREKFTIIQLPEVGSLLTLLTWMANALVQRPMQGSHWNEVRDAGCVHTQEGGQVLPVRPLAIYNLHSLRLSPEFGVLPRVSSHRTISKDTIIYLCQTAKAVLTELGVRELIRGKPIIPLRPAGDPWGAEEPSASQARLVPKQLNKQKKVYCRLASEAPDLFEGLIPEPQRRRGYDSEEEDPEEREEPVAADKTLSSIFHNYPVQIFSKVPNRRSPPVSWCLLSQSARLELKEEIFCDSAEPRRLFSSYTDYGFDRERWNKTVQVYFPTYSEHLKLQTPKIQGLSQLDIWSQWRMLVEESEEATRSKLVKVARKRVNDNWRWLPLFAKHHLWSTGATNVPGTARYIGEDKGGPWIVRNPKFRS